MINDTTGERGVDGLLADLTPAERIAADAIRTQPSHGLLWLAKTVASALSEPDAELRGMILSTLAFDVDVMTAVSALSALCSDVTAERIRARQVITRGIRHMSGHDLVPFWFTESPLNVSFYVYCMGTRTVTEVTFGLRCGGLVLRASRAVNSDFLPSSPPIPVLTPA